MVLRACCQAGTHEQLPRRRGVRGVLWAGSRRWVLAVRWVKTLRTTTRDRSALRARRWAGTPGIGHPPQCFLLASGLRPLIAVWQLSTFDALVCWVKRRARRVCRSMMFMRERLAQADDLMTRASGPNGSAIACVPDQPTDPSYTTNTCRGDTGWTLPPVGQHRLLENTRFAAGATLHPSD